MRGYQVFLVHILEWRPTCYSSQVYVITAFKTFQNVIKNELGAI